MTDSDLETVRMHAVQGLSRAVDPDAQQHFQAILDTIDAEVADDLVQCDRCGMLGSPTRIDGDHDCQ